MIKDRHADLKIRDLVEIPIIKTVIQLEDLNNPELRRMISETFVITSEVLKNLSGVFASLAAKEGRGIFLKGHFGSGKSHFLSMLSLLLKNPSAWEAVLDQAPALRDFKLKLEDLRLLMVEISLVQHRSAEFLEDIVLRAVFDELGSDSVDEFDGVETRHEIFSRLKKLLERKEYSGIVLLVDELSEFLRSKGDARAYNEDIRFLQYLGETAADFPLWVIASLQEWIEETGEIHQDTFNKIKDRYPVRLNLGRAHIEELISERLIRHKPEAENLINEIYNDLQAYFPTFPVPRERFVRLYPVHPATSSLLDRLKPLFSEHRGVVDFIHFRLKGDPERHIPSMLDRPAHELLTPEIVFDHFLDRIRERAETQIYVERVFEGFQGEIHELFQEEDRRRIALAALKLLILFAISPVKYKYTVRHIAEMVLFPITPVESEINYRFMYDLLEHMAKEGSYVRVEAHDDPLENHYVIDLKADVAGIVRKKIRHRASELFDEDHRLFWKVAPLVDSPYLPLKGWVEKGRQAVTVRWQHTAREGVLLFRRLDELSLDELKGLSRQWTRSEEDFFLLVGTIDGRDSQYHHVKEVLLPGIREQQPGTFLFWVPSGIAGDMQWLKELLAAILIRETTGAGSYENNPQGSEYLQAFIDKGKSRVVQCFTQSYYSGLLLWDENQVDLSRFGHLTQEKFLSEFVPPLLDRRFPGHSRIQPYMDTLAPGILKDMLMDFLSSGVLRVDDRSKFGIRDVLEGLLKPMGLVRKKGNQYELQINPKQNELARRFFTIMGERETVPLEEIYWTLRKGDYGLLMPHFEILVLALLFSGHLEAYKVMNRKTTEELARTRLKGVTSLGKGEILGEELRKILNDHPLIPRRFKNIPVTLASQEELWSEIKSGKDGALEDLANLKSRIHWASSFEAFKGMPWKKLIEDIDSLAEQWDQVKVSFSSREGLESFLRAGSRDPLLNKKLEVCERARAFLDRAEHALFVYQYVADQRISLPAGEWGYTAEKGETANGVRESAGLENYGQLKKEWEDILDYFQQKQESVSGEILEEIFERFKDFQEDYVRSYAESHHRARGAARFEPYERLKQSRRFKLLQRLDRFDMISVEHDRQSIDRSLSSVLGMQCLRSPQEQLRTQPICSCGFRFGESTRLVPLKETEEQIDKGLSETLEALKAPAIQEKIVPFLSGLDQVGRKNEADEIRQLMRLSPGQEGFLDRLDQILTPSVIRNVNEAFRGKVVVVRRDLDQLYASLIHRRYTLDQLRRVFKDWLKEDAISGDTFLHFVGRGEGRQSDDAKIQFRNFLEDRFGHLVSLYQELGYDQFSRITATLLWADVHQIPFQRLFEVLAFFNRTAKQDERLPAALLEFGLALRSEKPELFETVVFGIEEDPAFVQGLWSLLSAVSPDEVFEKESVFTFVLKEAFERLLCQGADLEVSGALHEAEAIRGGDRTLLEQRREDMQEALSLFHLFRKKSKALKLPQRKEPEDFSRWEPVFVKSVAPLPSLKGRLNEKLRSIGTDLPPFLVQEEQATERKLHEFTEGFRHFYRQALSVWEKSQGPRPTLIEDIPFLLPKKRKVPEHDKICYILLDGMRWDLWECIKNDFFGKRADLFRFVREGVLWTNQPTDTASQRPRFEHAFREAHPDLDPDENYWQASGLDEKIHSEKGPLSHLFAAVIGYLEIEWLFKLQKLPSRTLLVIFSDHGFVENPGFRPAEKYEAPRYLHGRDSPFEVIVPWAWLMRI